ncbi:MAG: hypothetical protein H6568_03715 [Lewinellaceae bacterium]|nr:hypothetical protein [Saprospiraceae bacterium]MCB9311848.1 hypothetical protein [Lewinellaceae bacterium]
MATVSLSNGGNGAIKIVPLNGIFGYPEMDSLVVCGAPDTLAFLVYFTGDEPVQNATLRLKLGGGIQFGGFATSPNPGTVQLLDNDPTKPRFLLPYVAQDSVAIVYVGIRATCSAANYFNPSIEAETRYTYQGNNCVDTYDFAMDLIQQAILVPVLNIRTPLPAPINFTSTNQTRCQTLTISQDGIRASLDSFTFMVDSLDLSVMDLVSITVNGQAFDLNQTTYDPGSKRLTGTITGNYFLFNTVHQGPPNMLFNTDERMTIQFCYSIPDCFYSILSNLKYTILQQCGDFTCTGVGDQTDAPVTFNPNFGATPRVTAELLQAPEVCGNPALIEVKLWSQQANPVTGLFEDMLLTFNACDSAGMVVNQIRVGPEGNEMALPSGIISYQGSRGLQVNLRDLDFNPDGSGGLIDSDGDGYYDDLAGGDTIRFVLEYAVNCPEILQGCFQVACRVENVRVEGLRHCKRVFSQTATPPTTPIIGFSSETSFAEDTAALPNLSIGYNFGQVGIVGGNPTAVTRTVGVDMNYIAENFVTCGGTHIAEIEIAGEAANNASFANAAFGPPGMEVPISGPYTVIDSPAVTYLRVEIPGPVDPMTDYRFKVDVTFDTAYCRPGFYMGISAKLKEDCDPACTCQVVKACGGILMYINPENTGCVCVSQTIVELERVSTGYTDKTLANRLNMADVPPDDRIRFLPGDTMLVRAKAWVKDPAVWNQVNSRLEFTLRDYPITINMSDRKRVRSTWDTRLARLQSATFKRGNTVLDLSGVACVDDGDGNDVSANTQSGLLLWSSNEADEPVFHPGFPTQEMYQVSTNASDDRFDGNLLGVAFRDQTVFSPGSNNPSDCLKPLLDLIGSPFELNDTFEFVWYVPVVSNPGFDPSAGSELQSSPLLNGVELIKRDYLNTPEVNLASTCWTNAPYSYHEPQIFANSEIIYDACGAEVVHTFEVANPPPANWFQSEYRPVIGLEQFYSVIPPPLAYAGGATMTGPDGNIQSIEPSGSRNNMTSFNYAGVTYYKPNQSDSQLWFNDAENEDGTATRYATPFGQDPVLSYDQGDNDLTRIGGTFPLIGVGLNNDDSLVFRIPLVRVCPGDVDESGLTLEYDASYRLLTNYNDPNGPFICNQTSVPGHPGNFYWGNCGPDNMTVGPRYWDFNSADTAHVMRFIEEQGINYFRTGTLDALPSLNLGLASILIGNNPGGPETNRLTLCAGPGTNDLADVVFTVTVTSTVMMAGIEDENGDPVPYTLVAATADSNVYLVNAASILAPNTCLEFDILTELLLCPSALPDPSIVPEPRICVNAAAGGCLPPAVVGILTGGTGGCTGASDCYFYTTDASDIQVEWVVSPQNIQLCEEVIYHARNKNVRSGTLFQPSFTFDVNDGVMPLPGSWEYAYPGGPNNMGPWMPAPDATMIEPGVWTFSNVGTFIPSVNAIGLPGVDATLDSNFIAIRFRATTVCDDFLSGVSPKVETDAFDGCGNIVDAFDFAPAVLADGANPLDFPRFIVVAEPDKLNCGVTGNQVTITGLALQGAGMTDQTRMCLTLPAGLTWAGNLDFVIPSAFTPPSIDISGGGNDPTVVCFDLPDGIKVGTLFVLEFDMDVDDSMACGEAAIETDIRTRVQSVECVNPASQCEAFVSNTLNREVFFLVEPPVDVVTQELYHTCDQDPLNTTYTYEVSLGYINTSLNSNATFSLYRDLDLNGVLDSYDPLLDSEMQLVNIPAGDTVAYTGSFTVPNALACPVFLVVDYDTPCACDRSVRYFDQIEPLFFADLPDAVYLCPGDDLEFETCSDFTLSFSPSDGATLTDLGGGMVRVTINPGFGEDQPVTLLAQSTAGSCDFASSRALYQLPNLDIGPYDPVRVCDNAITQLSLNLPPEWDEGAVILWSPALYLDDPTSANPEIIEPQSSVTYTVTVSFNDGQCSVSAPFPVIVESPGSLEVVSSADQGCVPIEQDVVLTATTGYDQYRLFQIIGGFPVFLEEGPSPIFMVPNNVVATYVIAGIDDDKPCEDVSDPVTVMAVYCRDFGDLPDTYTTLEGSNGPSHAIIPGLYLGQSVDDEPNGQPSANALGDGADEDGVNFLSHLQWTPGGTIRLPFSVVNTTGDISYVRVWIDWNGDGVFDPSELIESLDDDGQPYPAYLTIPIPNTAVKDQYLGFRIRLSLEDLLSFDGPSTSGEVEDYLIRLTCPIEICGQGTLDK